VKIIKKPLPAVAVKKTPLTPRETKSQKVSKSQAAAKLNKAKRAPAASKQVKRTQAKRTKTETSEELEVAVDMEHKKSPPANATVVKSKKSPAANATVVKSKKSPPANATLAKKPQKQKMEVSKAEEIVVASQAEAEVPPMNVDDISLHDVEPPAPEAAGTIFNDEDIVMV
jgi:hypothetical protein